MGQMVWGHQHKWPYPIITEAIMVTHNLTFLNAQNTIVYKFITKIKNII